MTYSSGVVSLFAVITSGSLALVIRVSVLLTGRRYDADQSVIVSERVEKIAILGGITTIRGAFVIGISNLLAGRRSNADHLVAVTGSFTVFRGIAVCTYGAGHNRVSVILAIRLF